MTKKKPAQAGFFWGVGFNLIYSIFELTAGFEHGDITCGDFDGLACLRVSTIASSAIFHAKGAETDKGHFVTLSELQPPHPFTRAFQA